MGGNRRARGKAGCGKCNFIHCTEVPGHPIKISLRSGPKIISTFTPNVYTEKTMIYVGGYAPVELRDDTAIPELCQVLGEVSSFGEPWRCKEMPGMFQEW